ncbi:S-layer homology domain-containing protein [Paenibacillus cisolokensis]|uniref:S-layer homology domain-containing protein n=1 Tax=Paenibacillus cisolokensis TaxID=1658519 RepID=UPI003D27BF4D
MVHKKIASALIAILMIFTLTGTMFAAPVEYGEELQNMPQNTPTVSFTDLPNTHWAYKYIAEMVNKKVLEGYPDHKFRPDNTISRAEFATIIVKAAGLQAKKVNYSSFSDVKVTDWYSPWIETAKDYLTGYRAANGEYIYNPTAPALREDITVAIVKLKGYDVARLANRSIIEAMFKDYEGISESAKDYVAIAVENGLVSGYPDETFRPQNSITRAEAAALLWRAFMYGNDNKGVGGGDQSTITPTIPTPPVTQPGQTAPSQPQQPSQAAKFSVDTLVGGMGAGIVDGPVRQAKISSVKSMTLDGDGNIFFLDSADNKNKVRKFNKSNGTVETITIDRSFDWDYRKDGKAVHYDYTKLIPKKLVYNQASNKVYLLGMNDASELIYEIYPTVQMAVYNLNSYRSIYKSYNFFQFLNDKTLVYAETESDRGESFVYQGETGSEVTRIAASNDHTGVKFWTNFYASYWDEDNKYGKGDAVLTDSDFYVFDTGNKTLSKIHLFPRKVESVIKFDNMSFDSLTAYEGKFYLSSGTTIYELTTDGKLNIFINGNDLTYNDGNPIKKISQLSFDSNGNVIIYDDDNKAIRRINL